MGSGLILPVRTKIRRVAMIVIVSALTLAISFIVYRNVAGFCSSQRRYLSDADMIRQAILYSLQEPPPPRIPSPDINPIWFSRGVHGPKPGLLRGPPTRSR
jgi:hypothetical protein